MNDALQKICDILAEYRFRCQSEAELQAAVEGVLKAEAIAYVREYTLGRDRFDFWLLERAIAVELKMDGSTMQIARQLGRYLAHPEVGGVLLVTTRSRHAAVPRELAGKPIGVHVVEGAL